MFSSVQDISINGSHIFTPLEPEKGSVTSLRVRVSKVSWTMKALQTPTRLFGIRSTSRKLIANNPRKSNWETLPFGSGSQSIRVLRNPSKLIGLWRPKWNASATTNQSHLIDRLRDMRGPKSTKSEVRPSASRLFRDMEHVSIKSGGKEPTASNEHWRRLKRRKQRCQPNISRTIQMMSDSEIFLKPGPLSN